MAHVDGVRSEPRISRMTEHVRSDRIQPLKPGVKETTWGPKTIELRPEYLVQPCARWEMGLMIGLKRSRKYIAGLGPSDGLL